MKLEFNIAYDFLPVWFIESWKWEDSIAYLEEELREIFPSIHILWSKSLVVSISYEELLDIFTEDNELEWNIDYEKRDEDYYSYVPFADIDIENHAHIWAIFKYIFDEKFEWFNWRDELIN